MHREHRNKIDFSTMYFYREFLKQKPDNVEVTQKTYTLILKTLFNLALEKIVTEAYRLIFPSLGLFYLIRKKQHIYKCADGKYKPQASVNWPETKKLIEKTGDKTRKVYYLNDHTDRNIYKVVWDRTRMSFLNKNFYIFVINKKHRQYLNKMIMSSDKPLNAYDLWFQ